MVHSYDPDNSFDRPTLDDVLAQLDGVVWAAGDGDAIGSASTALLVQALRTGGERHAERLVYQLGRRMDSHAVPGLAELLTSESEKIRAEVVEALGKIGDPRVGTALNELLLKEESEHVMGWLCEAAAACSGRNCIPTLVGLIRKPSTSDTVRGYAAKAALSLDPDLAALLASEAPALRDMLARFTPPPHVGQVDGDKVQAVGKTGIWEISHRTGFITQVFADGTVSGLDFRQAPVVLDEPEYPLWETHVVQPRHVVESLSVVRNDMISTIKRVLGRLDDIELIIPALQLALSKSADRAIEFTLRHLVHWAGAEPRETSTATVAALLGHPVPGVRDASWRHLPFVPSDPPNIAVMLARVEGETEAGVRHAAVSRLSYAGEPARRALTASLRSADPVERRAAAIGLRYLPPDAATEAALQQAAQSEDWSFARDAMLG